METTQFRLIPQTFDQAIDAAERFATSGMVPKTYTKSSDNPNAANKILVAWEYGASLGLGMMPSLQGIAIISGNPVLWGDAALAVIMASGELEDIDESVEGECTITRKGKRPKTIKFSMEDAKKAGLLTKAGPWISYPKRMLQMRVRAFALRDVFPDILKGMKIAEEVQDYPDAIETNFEVQNNKPNKQAIKANIAKAIEDKKSEEIKLRVPNITNEIIEINKTIDDEIDPSCREW